MGFWEVQLKGEWKSLGPVVGTAGNEAKARGATQLKFVSHRQSYLIDFNTMTQQNVNSGRTRSVRCKNASPRRDAPVHVHTPDPAPSAPRPSAPLAPAPAPAPVAKAEKSG